MTIEHFPDELAAAIDAIGLFPAATIAPANHTDVIERWFDGCLADGEAAKLIVHHEAFLAT